MSQEMSYQTSGINAETSAGGVRLNLIPREGGNRFTGDFRYSHPSRRLAVEQPDRPSRRRGTAAGNAIDRIIDATAPGRTDHENKLWFFVTARYNTVNTQIANTFFDDGNRVDDQFIKQALWRA